MNSIALRSTALQSHNFLDKWFRKQLAAFEEFRFGTMVIFLTAQSCWGSVATMFGLQSHAGTWAIVLSAAVTMGSNAMFISQASAKWSLLVFYFSLLVNTSLIIYFW